MTAADFALQMVREDLGLGPVKIAWVKDPAEIGGGVGLSRGSYQDRIWVLEGMDLEQTVKTVAHECRHLWQVGAGILSPLAALNDPNDAAIEGDAIRYERRAWDAFRRREAEWKALEAGGDELMSLYALLGALKSMNHETTQTRR